MSVETMDNRMVGRLGELLVKQKLIEQGWHPVRLDTAQMMATNADLLAIKEKQRVSLQVKTTNAKSGHSFSHSLSFGYATRYLRNRESIFNSKPSPLWADVIVGVHYDSSPRFVVLPVALAEKLCRCHCDYFYSVPKRDSTKRSPSFPIYLRLFGTATAHSGQHEKIKNNLLAFENRWGLLSKPVDLLHAHTAWSLKG